jgi:hypothetical protein
MDQIAICTVCSKVAENAVMRARRREQQKFKEMGKKIMRAIMILFRMCAVKFRKRATVA